MQVEIVNDGPVTVQLEFPDPEKRVPTNLDDNCEINQK